MLDFSLRTNFAVSEPLGPLVAHRSSELALGWTIGRVQAARRERKPRDTRRPPGLSLSAFLAKVLTWRSLEEVLRTASTLIWHDRRYVCVSRDRLIFRKHVSGKEEWDWSVYRSQRCAEPTVN